MRKNLWLYFAAIILAACVNDDETQGIRGSMISVGDDMPEFQLSGSDGETVSSASLRGTAYILSFFDTGCPDCQQEFPVLQRIYDKYGENMPVLNVPRSQSAEEVKAYWSKEKLTMPVYTAKDQNLYYKFAASGIPLTYIVNEEGKVCAVLTDNPIAGYDDIEALICPLLSDITRSGDVNLSFRMRLAAPLGSGDRGDYFQNEYAISRLEFFFFDPVTGNLLKRTQAEEIEQKSDINNYYDAVYYVPSLKVKAELYNIYLVANYYHMPDNIENQEQFLNTIDSVTYNAGMGANLPATGPVMTNRATSLLNIDLRLMSNKSYDITVELERVLAKLQIGVSQNPFSLNHGGTDYARINITNYKLVNLNKQYYLFQHKSNVWNPGNTPEFHLPDNFSDYNDENDYYVVDPLFYKKTSPLYDASIFRDNYVSWFGDYTTEIFASMPAVGSYGYGYILENTSYATSQKNGYSAGIVFKGSVSPTFVYMYESNTQTLVPENRPEYWPNTIYLYNFNFYGSISAVNIAGGLELTERNYTDSELKPLGIKQCKFNMGTYETYYTYWIRHQQTTPHPMSAMEYAVVRNNYYKITVVGVSGLGDSEIVPDIMRDNYPNSYEDIYIDTPSRH